MGERKGTRGLELWCKRMTEGYPGVKVDNMTTSWRDGLAFCAMIHHFRPDLIDFSKLNKDDIYYNNELAFRIAEDHLGIPALLEPEDMVEYSIPDRLSILTYLSQFYQAFAVNQSNPNSPTKTPPKRPTTADLHMVSATSSSPPKKVSSRIPGARRRPCAKCGLPVFIAERLNVGKTLYHRTCFRCARCDSQLALGNYYETENNGFCCETCPDEEKVPKPNSNILTKSLSDEEKTASIKGEKDLYSANFENVLEDSKDPSLRRNFTLDRVIGANFTRAMSDFLTTQVDSSDPDSDSESDEENEAQSASNAEISLDPIKHSESVDMVTNKQLLPSLSDSGFPNFKVKDQHSDLNSYESQHPVTKDSISTQEDPLSLSFKSRLKLFERDDADNNKKSDVNKVNISLGKEVLPEKTSVEEKVESANIDDSVEASSKCEESLADSCTNEESALSPIEISSDVNMNEPNELYEADVSSLNESVKCSEVNESCIVISSENTDPSVSGIGNSDVINAEQSDLQNNSVITIPDTSDDLAGTQQSTENSESVVNDSKTDNDVEYPDDLNPFGDDENDEDTGFTKSKSTSLNPFGDSEEEEDIETKPVAAPRRLISPKSMNPFEDDEDENDDIVPIAKSITPQPAARKLIKAPKISLTPYWKTDSNPIPTPRLRTSTKDSFETSSLTRSGRKKKPAPKPPILKQELNESPLSSLTSSPSQSVCHSPRSTPKLRKMKKAPLPPGASTPLKSDKPERDSPSEMPSPINNKPLQFRVGSEENLKSAKDEMNRNVQQHTPDEGPSSLPNKSTYGKWKRRKGQAPPRPIPHKRSIKSLPIEKIKHELDVIEVQQLGLEKQSVTLEKLIREKSECPGSNEDAALAPEVEDMVLQLFELVNEKNELFRKQAELMYLRRQHRLEEEYAEVEYQIRCLMLQPEAKKTDSDKCLEEQLINRLLEIVERRNEIVDCLEMDRRRAEDEDSSIINQMNLFTLKRDESTSSQKKKSKKEHKKDKKKRSKSKNKVDDDKDIDETETSTQKEKKKKKKFNLF